MADCHVNVLRKVKTTIFEPSAARRLGAAAGSGQSRLSTELEGAGFARAPLSQADESGEAPWVTGSSCLETAWCGGPCVSSMSTWLRVAKKRRTVQYMVWMVSDQCGDINSHSIIWYGKYVKTMLENHSFNGQLAFL